MSGAPAAEALAAALVGSLLHDLAGPLSAVSAGAELLGAADADVAAVVLEGCALLTARISFARAAFGAPAVYDRIAIEDLCRPLMPRRAELAWEQRGLVSGSPAQAALLGVQLAAPSLARGGLLRVTLKAEAPWSVRLLATGPRAVLDPRAAAGLEGRTQPQGPPGLWAPARWLALHLAAEAGTAAVRAADDGFAIELFGPPA